MNSTITSVKQLKTFLHSKGIYPERLSKRNGVFTYKRSFFYTHGNSSSKIAAKLAEVLKEYSFELVDDYDDWKSWPKTSYFVVKFTLNNENQNNESTN